MVNRSGGSANDLIGWYPDTLEPDGNLNAVLGQEANGTWTLHVSDHAGADLGMLNEWCLRIRHSGNPTAVADEKLPTTLALYANRPNPVSTHTILRFALPVPSAVDLAIFDISGRRVATLFSGSMPAGHHEAAWQGTDDAGRSLPGALYFYRLKVGEETLTRKLMLLK